MSAEQQDLVMMVSGETLKTMFLNLRYYAQYNCCVEVLYSDSSENALTCLIRSTEESGKLTL